MKHAPETVFVIVQRCNRSAEFSAVIVGNRACRARGEDVHGLALLGMAFSAPAWDIALVRYAAGSVTLQITVAGDAAAAYLADPPSTGFDVFSEPGLRVMADLHGLGGESVYRAA